MQRTRRDREKTGRRRRWRRRGASLRRRRRRSDRSETREKNLGDYISRGGTAAEAASRFRSCARRRRRLNLIHLDRVSGYIRVHTLCWSQRGILFRDASPRYCNSLASLPFLFKLTRERVSHAVSVTAAATTEAATAVAMSPRPGPE